MKDKDRTKIIERLAICRDEISKNDPLFGSAIADILLLLVDDYWSLRDKILKIAFTP